MNGRLSAEVAEPTPLGVQDSTPPSQSNLPASIVTYTRHLFDISSLNTPKNQEWIRAEQQRVFEKFESMLAYPNPKMQCRKCLCEWVLGMARYWILVMKPPPAPEESGFRGLPGITGELYPHLIDLAQKDKHLSERLRQYYKRQPTKSDIYNYALFKYWHCYIWVTALNAIRVRMIGDYNPDQERDWFKPLLHAMCAWQESNYRKELGMPNVLEPGSRTTLVALMYSTLLNMVLNGIEQPYVHWLEEYKGDIAGGTLKIPDFSKSG